MEESLNTRKITFNDPSLYDDEVSSDNDIFSASVASETFDLSFAGVEITQTASSQLKTLPLQSKKFKSSAKISGKNGKSDSDKISQPTTTNQSRATTARPYSARPKEIPFRLKFPVKKISISSPDGLFNPDAGMKIFPEIASAISRPQTGRRSIHSRPETAYNITEWDSRPHTARFKEKKVEKIPPIIPLTRKAVVKSEKERIKEFFHAQRELETKAAEVNGLVIRHPNEHSVELESQDQIGKLLNTKLSVLEKKFSHNPSENISTPEFASLSIVDDSGEFFIESEHVSACFLIIRGHINQESDAFALFLKESVEKYNIPVGVTQYFLEKFQKLSYEYNIPFAECSISKILKFLQLPDAWRLINKDFLISAMHKKDEIRKQLEMPGSHFKGINRRNIAATKIQSIYRMKCAKDKFNDYIFRRRCARIIIRFLRDRIKKRKRLETQTKLLDLSVLLVKEMNLKFQEEWESEYVNNPEGRMTIILNSISFHQNFRSRITNITEQQKHNYGRLLQLLDSKISVVYITPEMSTSDRLYLKSLISIHWNYQELIATNRLKIIELIRPLFFFNDASLSTVLLMDSAVKTSLSKHVENKKVYLEALIANKEECRLCELLKIPLYGNPELAIEFAHNKSKQRIFAQESGCRVPTGFSFAPQSLPMAVTDAISNLISNNANVKIWIFKINNFGNGEGLAYFTVPFYFKRPIKVTQDDMNTYTKYVSPSWNGNWKQYSKLLLANGGVVEAYAPTKNPHHISFHMEITPSFRLLYTGSNSLIPGSNLLTVSGSCMPHIYQDQKAIHQEATLIGEALVADKYIGPITVDLVCWEEIHKTTVWVTSIKLFYTTTRDKFNLSKFIARDSNLEGFTILQEPSPDCFPKFPNLTQLQYFDTSNHFKTYVHNPTASARVSMHLSNLTYSGGKFLSKDAFQSFFVQADAVISKQGLGAMALIEGSTNASLLFIQEDLNSCAKKAFDCLFQFKKNVVTPDETDNFLAEIKNVFHFLSNLANQKQDQHLLNLQNFKDFEKNYLSSQNNPQRIHEDGKQKSYALSAGTIKLLAMDIPSQSLRLFDSGYGKHRPVRPLQIPHRIEAGIYTPEEYVDMVEVTLKAKKNAKTK